MAEKFNWIIAISNSDLDGVELHTFQGNEYQAKRLLVKMVKYDKSVAPDAFDWGTTCISDIEVTDVGELNAYACFSDSHIDYTAVKTGTIMEVTIDTYGKY